MAILKSTAASWIESYNSIQLALIVIRLYCIVINITFQRRRYNIIWIYRNISKPGCPVNRLQKWFYLCTFKWIYVVVIWRMTSVQIYHNMRKHCNFRTLKQEMICCEGRNFRGKKIWWIWRNFYLAVIKFKGWKKSVL